MVSDDLRAAVEAMSLGERFELIEYIERAIDSSPIEVSDEQKMTVRSRAAELQADPSIGLSWDELKARIGSRWE